MRGRMSDAPSYAKPVSIGGVMEGGAASGAVGSVVGQIARLKGAYAVGIAGGPNKCRHVTEELGFDACIDHRTSDFVDRLAAACPKGIDVYFENVGGAVFEAVFPLLNPFARILRWSRLSEQEFSASVGGASAKVKLPSGRAAA